MLQSDFQSPTICLSAHRQNSFWGTGYVHSFNAAHVNCLSNFTVSWGKILWISSFIEDTVQCPSCENEYLSCRFSTTVLWSFLWCKIVIYMNKKYAYMLCHNICTNGLVLKKCDYIANKMPGIDLHLFHQTCQVTLDISGSPVDFHCCILLIMVNITMFNLSKTKPESISMD